MAHEDTFNTMRLNRVTLILLSLSLPALAIVCYDKPHLLIVDLLRWPGLFLMTGRQLLVSFLFGGLVTLGFEYLYQGSGLGIPNHRWPRILAIILAALLFSLSNQTLNALLLKDLVLRCGTGTLLLSLLLLRDGIVVSKRSLVFFVVWSGLLGLFTISDTLPRVSLKLLLDFFLLFIIWISLCNFCPARGNSRTYLVIFSGYLMTISAIYGIMQSLGMDILDWEDPGWGLQRPYSFFGNPNFFAAAMIVGILFNLAGILVPGVRRWFKIFSGAGMLLCSGAVVLSFSRTGYLVLTLILIILLVQGISRNSRMRTLIAGLLFLSGILALLFDPVRTRIVSFVQPDRSITSRLYLWKSAIDAAVDHPLTGTGLNTFQYDYTSRISPDFFALYPHRKSLIRHAHSELLQQLSETGFPITLFLVSAVLSLLWDRFTRLGKTGREETHVINLVTVLSLLSILIFSLFSMLLRSLYFQFILVLLIWLTRHHFALEKTSPPLPFLRLKQATIFLGTIFLSVLFFQPFLASSYLNRAFRAISSDRLEEGNRFLRLSLLYEPEDPLALINLAGLDLRRGDIETARADAMTLFRITRSTGNPAHLLTIIEKADGQIMRASAFLPLALRFDPKNPQVLMLSAELSQARGDLNRAEIVLDRARRSVPELGRDYTWNVLRARIEIGRGNPSAALPFIRQAIETNPDGTEAKKMLERVSGYPVEQ